MIDRLIVFCVRLTAAAFRALGWRACRFAPTCSEYASQAYRRFSGWPALRLTVLRFLRCHPFCAGGHDPLPESI